jgi:3-phenylpropionate/trans-cinnamate dioxygenase ferredoxin reductase component
MTEAGIVIVGAGEAGACAALALRESGWTGRVTLIGEELEPPYERPPLSKTVITATVEPSAPVVLGESLRKEKQIEFLAGVQAVAIDRANRSVELEDGRRIPYRKLLLATGARSRQLSIAGSAQPLYLRTFSEALTIRAQLRPGSRIGIVGGGFIGMELAASARQRGCKVTVFEMAPRILMRCVPPEIADAVARRHRVGGVELRTDIRLQAIEGSAAGQSIVLTDGTKSACDGVIVGIGAIPETNLASKAGLDLENGVRVDTHLQTSDSDIFAAGDCCSFPHPLYDGRRIRLEAWRNAREQGAHAARNMLGADAVYDAVPSFWSDQFDLTLRIVGLPDAAATTVTRSLDADVQLHFHLAEDGRLIAASAIGPDAKIAKEVRLAEMLIAKRPRPDPNALARPEVRLKSLLAA